MLIYVWRGWGNDALNILDEASKKFKDELQLLN